MVEVAGADAGADSRSSLGLLGAVLLSDTVWNVQLSPSFTHALQHSQASFTNQKLFSECTDVL